MLRARVAHPCSDDQLSGFDCKLVESGNLVDVDQVNRARHPERHDRHQTLAAGENAAIIRRHLIENF
jgi:hypothetical protein